MNITGILDITQTGCSEYKTMVCTSANLQNTLVEKLLELDCKVYIPVSKKDAIEKLRCHTFDLIICEENYSIELIQILQNLPMSIRRNIFFVFIGQEIETFNFMQSLVLSANLLINTEDISQFENILMEGLAENKRFFRPFTISLENLY